MQLINTKNSLKAINLKVMMKKRIFKLYTIIYSKKTIQVKFYRLFYFREVDKRNQDTICKIIIEVYDII